MQHHGRGVSPLLRRGKQTNLIIVPLVVVLLGTRPRVVRAKVKVRDGTIVRDGIVQSKTTVGGELIEEMLRVDGDEVHHKVHSAK
jgi:hypothetical protein